MANRKTTYENEREQLRKMGYRPEGMTIRQQFEALGGRVFGKSLFEVSGVERPSDDLLIGQSRAESASVGCQIALF